MENTITTALAKRGRGKAWLARESGVSRTTIHNIINGSIRNPDTLTIQKICKALSSNPVDIFLFPDLTISDSSE